jgi:hypothetical protein
MIQPTPEQITILHHILRTDLDLDPEPLARTDWEHLWSNLERIWSAGRLSFVDSLEAAFEKLCQDTGRPFKSRGCGARE